MRENISKFSEIISLEKDISIKLHYDLRFKRKIILNYKSYLCCYIVNV